MSDKPLKLEILAGPLDGATITLEFETKLSRVGEGSLFFPWDLELGTPQAGFFFEDDNWCLEGFSSPHGTYRVNHGERITEKIPLSQGDIIKASQQWFLVREC